MKQIVCELKNKVNGAGLMSVMYAFSTALISGTVLMMSSEWCTCFIHLSSNRWKKKANKMITEYDKSLQENETEWYAKVTDNGAVGRAQPNI